MGRNSEDGLGRLGGREKGTPNKKSTVVESLLDIENTNLPLEILKCCESLKPIERAQVMLRLMDFVYPKKKAIAFVSPEEQESRVTKIILQKVGGRKEMQRLKELEEKEKKLEEFLNKYPHLSI